MARSNKLPLAALMVISALVASSCASTPPDTRGTFSLGDTGPGGGIVFHVAAEPFACGPERRQSCKYLEVSPIESEVHQVWSSPHAALTLSDTINSSSIGSGYRNSINIAQSNPEEETAAAYALGFAKNGKDDWYLPSIAELNELCKFSRGQLTSSSSQCFEDGSYQLLGMYTDYYWSSSPAPSTEEDRAWAVDVTYGTNIDMATDYFFRVRPIRSF